MLEKDEAQLKSITLSKLRFRRPKEDDTPATEDTPVFVCNHHPQCTAIAGRGVPADKRKCSLHGLMVEMMTYSEYCRGLQLHRVNNTHSKK